jgi:hypothetical protein
MAVVAYIAGFVVKIVKRKICCPTCVASLICSRQEAEREPAFALLNRKRWGNLVDASTDVISICLETENFFSFLVKDKSFFCQNLIEAKIANAILQHFFCKSE